MYKVVIITSILLLINFVGCFEKTTSDLSRNMDERLIGTWIEIGVSIDQFIFYSYGGDEGGLFFLMTSPRLLS